MEMTLEDKRKAYDKLNNEQKKELKNLLEYFDNGIWFVEPSKELFGVKWYQEELRQIIK